MNVNPRVFLPSAGVILLFIGLGVGFPSQTESAFQALQDYIVATFGWFYVVAVTFFLGFLAWLFFSRFGTTRLGKDDDRPRYKNWTWFAMLFSAGMGIGLVFFSVSEPVLHFIEPPSGEGGTVDAAQRAMSLSFLHWGLHAWAIYGVVGLSLAYFSYRHDLPLTIRSTLYPLLGKRIETWMGDVVDVLAVFATLFGIATSLGFGALQVSAGLDHLGLVSIGLLPQVLLVSVLTLAATVSAVSGLERGVRRLSQMNLILAVLLVAFVLVVGPTIFLAGSFLQNIGHYLQNFPALTLQTDAFEGPDWQKQWTMFYWGWWISWSPFVGVFIARISRGRTVRAFIGGVLLVPTAFTFAWFVVFGNTAMHMELFGAGGVAAAVSADISTGLFALLERLPLTIVTVAVALAVIAAFFVTSADSGSLVVDQLTSHGSRPSTRKQRAFWALAGGGVAITLLLSGGLLALQTATVTTALPFAIILLFMCRSLLTGLRAEEVKQVDRTIEAG